MTETEKRRRELLEQTRRLYSDKYIPPAIHPRYQSAYQSLYKTQNYEKKSGFGKTLLLIILFGVFVMAARSEDFDVKAVINQISQDVHSFVDLQIFD